MDMKCNIYEIIGDEIVRIRENGPKVNQTKPDECMPNQEQALDYFGRRIIKLMAERDESVHGLSAAIGVADNVTLRWVSGKSFPNLNTAFVLAKHYDMTVDELMKGMNE